MYVSDIRAQVLADIAEHRRAGSAEVLASIPAYVGPWAVAAMDAARVLSQDDEAQALFIYDHLQVREQFTEYIQLLLGHTAVRDRLTVASSSSITTTRHGRHTYVASAELSWQRARERLAPRFVLRHNRTPVADTSTSTVTARPYVQAGFLTPAWTRTDSIRYYKELYFARGRHVTRRELALLTGAGEGPSKNRLYREDIGSLDALRAAAHLDDSRGYRPGPLTQREQ